MKIKSNQMTEFMLILKFELELTGILNIRPAVFFSKPAKFKVISSLAYFLTILFSISN